jgi:hypothetical protein
MPREVLEFRIIVASPSDVFDARKVAFNVIDELSRAFEIQGISIRGLGWEEYASPGIATHAQTLINEQLLKEYDILVAIFGTKLGSPTATAASGTVEEIEHAIAKTDSEMGNYRVQVYFRDRIDSTADLSADELKKLFEYRDQLKERGVLYKLFKDEQELEHEIRANLQRPILEFLQTKNKQSSQGTLVPVKPQSSVSTVGAETESTSTTEELGLLDHLERGEDAMQTATSSMQRISSLIKEIGDETGIQVDVFEKISDPNISAKEKKAVINNFATFLKSKAIDLKQQAIIAQEGFASFVAAMIVAARIQREYGDVEKYRGDVAEFLNVAETVLATLALNRESITRLRTVVENLPRITIQFNQAKRQLLDALTECLQVFDGAERGIFEITAGT